MRICFLGTGGSWPSKRRNVSSIAVSSGSTTVLLDCGEGTQRQLLSSPVSPMKIRAILVSHLHGDHFLGIPGLVQTMSLNDRDAPMDIYGPAGTLEALEKGLTMCPFSPNFNISGHELEPGDTFSIDHLTISCGRAAHGSLPSLSYRINEPDRPGRFNREKALELNIPEGPKWGMLQRGEDITIGSGPDVRTVVPREVVGPPRDGISLAYSGDTAPCDEVEELARGATVLIHEATFADSHQEVAAAFGHSTARGAAALAKRAKVSRLFLVHISPRYQKEEELKPLIDQATEVFEGAMVPEDGNVIEVTH
ncbi:MAG: ribonuclease Z [Thermoplasmata archaeon]|nr:ribonuclease Z [Thermoplasmata archaeon]